MVSDTLMRKRWCGHGLVFDRIYRINRIEGRREERGRRGNHAEDARGKRKTPIVGKATLTLRRGHGVSYLEGLAVTTRDSTCSGVFSLLLPVS